MNVADKTSHKDYKDKTVIGWSEAIDFPDWGILGIRAKVDTGARSSALHVEELEILPDGHARFFVILNRQKPYKQVEIIAPVTKWARVRSSTGVYSRRCFVQTRIRIGQVEKEIEISLVSRKKMLFRMLLGRKALEKDFLVDVNRRNVLGKKKRRVIGKSRGRISA
jgi:hypothetical protein